MTLNRKPNRGFTLVEILIVVIILGILAAIVIPQFTNASTEARNNSTSSLLQTLRSQIELYKLQHNDELPPTLGTGTNDWTAEMTVSTDALHAAFVAGTSTTGPFGPYMQSAPKNVLNGSFVVEGVAADIDPVTYDPADGAGFVFNTSNGKIWATNADYTAMHQE
jgi:general secretion pathway protein G